MTYEIQLMDENTKQVIHHFDSVFIPMAGDIYPLPPVEKGICFIVKCRMLPDSNSNLMVCFGTIQNVGNLLT